MAGLVQGQPWLGQLTGGTRLAVLGSPIAHSKSPALHRAAYRTLGLNWSYDAIEVTRDALANFVASRDEEWRGLSLTMPLKRDVLPLLDSRDAVVDAAGGANTLLFDFGRSGQSSAAPAVRGYNTDVYGVVAAFARAGVSEVDSVHILGGGATAASVLVAVHRMGARRARVSVRTPSKAMPLVELGQRLGVVVRIGSLGDDGGAAGGARDDADSAGEPDDADAVISTLPGDAAGTLAAAHAGAIFSEQTRRRAVLLDVSYDPWPSVLAERWQEVGGTVIPGTEMLLQQAVAQIRIFLSGNPEARLPDEESVVASMRAALDR